MKEIVVQPKISIIKDWMPKYPNSETMPYAFVVAKDEGENRLYLRYSRGPRQGHFWDIYPEDYQTEELARKAIDWINNV